MILLKMFCWHHMKCMEDGGESVSPFQGERMITVSFFMKNCMHCKYVQKELEDAKVIE